MMDVFFSLYTLIYIPMALSIFVRGAKSQNFLVFFWIIVLTLFRGLRWDLGTDWYWYEKSFEDIDVSNFLLFVTKEEAVNTKILEQGWATLMLLSKYVYPYYTSFLIISNFILLFVYYKMAKLLTNNVLPCFVFMVFSNQFFPIRQTFAVAFFMLGVCYVLKGDKIKYIYSVLTSIFFHYSTVFVSFYYFVLKKVHFSYLVYVGILISSLVIEPFFDIFIHLFIFIADFVGLGWLIMAEIGAEANEVQSVFGSITTFFSGLFFVSYIYYYGIIKVPQIYHKVSPEYYTIFHSLMFMMVISYVINIVFLRNFTYLSRMASYFGFALPILFFVMYDKQKGSARLQSLIVVFVFLMYRYFYKLISYYPELHFPYNSVFD